MQSLNIICNTLFYSLTWLKLKLKKLGLKSQHSDSNYSVVKTLIKKILETSKKVKGCRAVWKHLRDKYNCIVRRLVFPYSSKNVLYQGYCDANIERG